MIVAVNLDILMKRVVDDNIPELTITQNYSLWHHLQPEHHYDSILDMTTQTHDQSDIIVMILNWV